MDGGGFALPIVCASEMFPCGWFPSGDADCLFLVPVSPYGGRMTEAFLIFLPFKNPMFWRGRRDSNSRPPA